MRLFILLFVWSFSSYLIGQDLVPLRDPMTTSLRLEEVGISHRLSSEPNGQPSALDWGAMLVAHIPPELSGQEFARVSLVVQTPVDTHPDVEGLEFYVAIYEDVSIESLSSQVVIEGVVGSDPRQPDVFGSVSRFKSSFLQQLLDVNEFLVTIDLQKDWKIQGGVNQSVEGVCLVGAFVFDPSDVLRPVNVATSVIQTEDSYWDAAIDGEEIAKIPNIAGNIFVLGPVLLGDVNNDGDINLLDVAPFVEVLTKGGFQAEADINQDETVDLLDVAPFVDLLSGG